MRKSVRVEPASYTERLPYNLAHALRPMRKSVRVELAPYTEIYRTTSPFSTQVCGCVIFTCTKSPTRSPPCGKSTILFVRV